MAPDRSQDDASQVVVLLDVNPFFWGARTHATAGSNALNGLHFSKFIQHVVLFVNSVLLLNNLNQLVVIAAGAQSCSFIFNSESGNIEASGNKHNKQHLAPSAKILRQIDKFLEKEVASDEVDKSSSNFHSLLSGALSMALCYIQRSLKAGPPHPQPRILCLQGTSDAPQQYVAVMNAIFSAQRSMIPIDTCMLGAEHSAFLQQAAHITGGIYMKPSQLEGLFQYLSVVFATDLHSRRFLQLPRPMGVDFRASCFCHKKTIDLGFVCSVCLSIFCKRHNSCSTCGAKFNQSRSGILAGEKRKEADK